MTDNELRVWIGKLFQWHLGDRAWSSGCQCGREIHGVLVHIEIFTEERGVVVVLSEGCTGDGWQEGRRVTLAGQHRPNSIKDLVWGAKLGFIGALRDLEANAAFTAQREAAALRAMLLVGRPEPPKRL